MKVFEEQNDNKVHRYISFESEFDFGQWLYLVNITKESFFFLVIKLFFQ